MDWVNHPAYSKARDELVTRFKEKVYSFKHFPPFIFLCGGRDSECRQHVARYLRQQSTQPFVFYAEDVWDQVSDDPDLNALQMEAQLAKLADILIVIVESAGTIAELGAFASHSELRSKMLPIVNARYRDDQSFIDIGPLRWIGEDSKFAPPVYTDFAVILQCMPEVDDRLSRIPMRGRLSLKHHELPGGDPKHLLLLLADVVAVMGPTSAKQCSEFLLRLLGIQPRWSVASLLGLASSLDLIQALEYQGTRHYYRRLEGGELPSYQHRKKMLNIPQERARFLGVLQTIPSARSALSMAR
jgi:hypothetical protein